MARLRCDTYDPQTDPRVLKSIQRHREKVGRASATADAAACVRCGRTFERTDAGRQARVVLLTPGQRFGLKCGACARVFCNECLAGTTTGGDGPRVRNLSLECPECDGRLEVAGAG